MLTPKLPLIIRSSSEVFYCRTVESAERELEPVDVRNGEYTGYDREGRLLAITVLEREVPTAFGLRKVPTEAVRIEVAEERPTHAADLRLAVVDHLDRVGAPTTGHESLSLAELLLGGVPYVDIY